MKNIRSFLVEPVLRGYVVIIGCQRLGFSNLADLRAAINEYFDDPEGIEKRYYPAEAHPQAEACRVGSGSDESGFERAAPKTQLDRAVKTTFNRA